MPPEASMTGAAVRPFNQKIRIAGLRLGALALVPALIVTRPVLHGLPAVLLHVTGILCIVAAVLGRFWAILYIGGHKNRSVMQDGPYSICRHPLYMSSTIGATGFGLMLGSLTVTALIGGFVFAVLSATAARDERDLRRLFSAAYAGYATRVPRLLPRVARFRTPAVVTFDVATLTRNTRDALVFLGLISLADVLNWLHASGLLPAVAVW